MKILVNENWLELDQSTTLFDLKKTHAPDSDIWIYNGFPVKEDRLLKNLDEVFFIKRGEMPSEDQMEHALVSRHTPGVHQRVKKATVGIAGLGGLGSNIAMMLARIGVGKLVLVDFDIVEPSNLNRQQFFIKHLGLFKTEAMVEMIESVNPYIAVETHNVFIDEGNIDELFGQVDIVVEAFDTPSSKALLVNHILHHYPNKYIVAASGLAGYYSNNSIQTKRISPYFYLIGDDTSEAKPGCGLMAPRATLAAAHQANTVLRILMGECDVE